MGTLLSDHFDNDYSSITLHETCDDDELVCVACGDLVIGGPTYIIEVEGGYHRRLYLHKSCGDLPNGIRHPLHPWHDLKLVNYNDGFICDGCRHVSFDYLYRCSKKCRFMLDSRCASKNEGQALKERVEKHTIYHRHKLQLVYFRLRYRTDLSEYMRCCCCLKSCPDGRDTTYSCNVCYKSKNPFLIHKSCLDTLPRQVQSSFHPEHPLFTRRLLEDDEYNCGVCYDKITGFALACNKCDIKLHVSCGSRTTRGLRVDDLDEHDMHYVILRTPDLHPCTLCRAGCEGAFYRCVKCDVNVHMECIPLPEFVEHESHDHPLKLTDSVVTHRDDDEYRCDICEEEGNIKHHSYYCNECNYIAHIECVLSEDEDDTSETPDAEVETDDADIENDDAEKKSKDEVHDSQEGWDSEDFCDGQQYHQSNVDDRIEKFMTKIEELASELEAVANLDQRIEKVKADMVKLFDDLMEEFIKSVKFN